jgi:hypothetical protein
MVLENDVRHGIGITTRNRPYILRTSLEYFAEFHTNESKYVIVDDASDGAYDAETHVKWFMQQVDAEVIYRKSPHRLGIAAAKNACLAKLLDCDNLFLFDDDAWPQIKGWADKWAAAANATGIHHSMMITKLSATNDFFRHINTVGEGELAMCEWTNCLGCALHFTRHAIEVVGGYDAANAKNVYGYEHAQMSQRCSRAGITQGVKYASPKDIMEWVYAVDISWGWLNQEPVHPIPWILDFKSSVTPEEANGTELNSHMMHDIGVFKPLVDPIIDVPVTVDAIIPCKINFDGLAGVVANLVADPSVGEVVIVADGKAAYDEIHRRITHPVTLMQVEESIGLHNMWNMGIRHLRQHDRHLAIINDDVTLSNNAIGIAASLLDRRPELGLISPINDLAVHDEFIGTTGFAGFCMVMAKDLVQEWLFDENMKWWYGDNDVITWVHRVKERGTGFTGLCHAVGNESKTIHMSPPPNFHSDIENDARIYKEKWDNHMMTMENNKMTSLHDFAGNTDKSWAHQYIHFYDGMLRPIRESCTNVLELGVWYGGSIRMWRDYFSNATITGVDISDLCEGMQGEDRIEFVQMDGYNQDAISYFGDRRFDFIIDDGPHTLESQCFAAANYVNLLKPNGVFMIEDIPNPDWIPKISAAVPEEFQKYSYAVDRRWVPGTNSIRDELIFVVDKRYV